MFSLTTDSLLRILAAIVARSSSGVVRFTPHQLSQAPVALLHITEDDAGDLWLRFSGPPAGGDEDTWPIEE